MTESTRTPRPRRPASGTGPAADQRRAVPAVSRAWAPFTAELARVLAVLEEDSYLVLESKRRGYYVQFAAQGAYGLRLEAVSNAFLDPGETLGEAQTRRLAELGWLEPSGPPETSDTPEKSPEGSPNFYREWEPPVPAAEAASLAVATLREVYGVAHPGHLVYAAFAAGGEGILLPTLRLKRAPRTGTEAPAEPEGPPPLLVPGSPEELFEAALGVLRKATGQPDLAPDGDGDVPLRHGSAVVFVRALGHAPVLELFSPLLSDLPSSAPLLEALNDLNRQHAHVRFFHADDTVFACLHLLASPFIPGHLTDALTVLADICDEVDTELQARFGGTTYFHEPRGAKPDRGRTRIN